MPKPSWKSRSSYEKNQQLTAQAVKPTTVPCPVCAAQRGDRCVFPDTQRQRKRPHKERHAAAKAIQAERDRRARRIRGQQAKRWRGVTILRAETMSKTEQEKYGLGKQAPDVDPGQARDAETCWLLDHPVPGGLLDRVRR
jgi:hypothetical protein